MRYVESQTKNTWALSPHIPRIPLSKWARLEPLELLSDKEIGQGNTFNILEIQYNNSQRKHNYHSVIAVVIKSADYLNQPFNPINETYVF